MIIWTSLYNLALYFLLFLLAATVVFGLIWAKYIK